MGGVFCNCFEYPRRTFCVEYHTLYPTEIDVYLNHYTLHDATRIPFHIGKLPRGSRRYPTVRRDRDGGAGR